MSEIRKFVAASSREGNVYNEDLAKCALFLLQNVPPSRNAVLEYMCNAFDEAVNIYVLKIGRGEHIIGEQNKIPKPFAPQSSFTMQIINVNLHKLLIKSTKTSAYFSTKSDFFA